MSVIPCCQNVELKRRIKEFSEVLKTEAHKLGDHGLDENEFYNSGLFRGSIERVRGQFSATMGGKRQFTARVLNHMQDIGYVADWNSAGDSNRYDYLVTLPSGRITAIELKGCLDGNNTNIFERPPQADEFVIWSVCTNPGADPRRNAWSGIHTRLSADIISRSQRVDGVVIWDMVCGTIGRPCPKLDGTEDRLTEVGQYRLPPACIYVFPSTIPSPRSNPNPQPQKLVDVRFLEALHECFHGDDSEINYVDFAVEHVGKETVRTTTIKRGDAVVKASTPTAIKRA